MFCIIPLFATVTKLNTSHSPFVQARPQPQCASSHLINKLPHDCRNGWLKHVAVNEYTVFMEQRRSKSVDRY